MSDRDRPGPTGDHGQWPSIPAGGLTGLTGTAVRQGRRSVTGYMHVPRGEGSSTTAQAVIAAPPQERTGSEIRGLKSSTHTHSPPPPRVRAGRGQVDGMDRIGMGWRDASAQERHGTGPRGVARAWSSAAPCPRGPLARGAAARARGARRSAWGPAPPGNQAEAPRQPVSSPLSRPRNRASSRPGLATPLRGGMFPAREVRR